MTKTLDKLNKYFERHPYNPFLDTLAAFGSAILAVDSFEKGNYLVGGIMTMGSIYFGLESYLGNRERDQRIASLEEEIKSLKEK